MPNVTRNRRSADAPRRDLYQEVTDTILASLEAGTVPWHQPWKYDATVGLPTSISTGKGYRGVNVFVLWMTAQAKGYSSPWWGTFNAIKERGGMVRKGEKGTTVVFWKRLVVKVKPEERAANGGKDTKVIPMLRHFVVFNAAQADGLPERFTDSPTVDLTDFDPIATCEEIVEGYTDGPVVVEGHDGGAWYSPQLDRVSLPPRGAFDSAEAYYSTMFHELGHSTGHASRLNRPGIVENHRFGDELYSKEELVAEMTAAMLSAVAGIHQRTVPASAAYLEHWMRVLRGDPKLIISAGGAAQRAADRILGTKFEEEAEQ